MKTLCVVLEGQVINVGAWQNEIALQDPETGDVQTIANPLPDGAQFGEFDIEWTADGRIVLASDYRDLRAAEYPPIGDQLDALFHAGIFPPDMAAAIAAVKAKYPKPAAS